MLVNTIKAIILKYCDVLATMDRAGMNTSRLMRNALNEAIVRARRDSTYAIDERIQPLSIAAVAGRRALAGARGLIRKKLFGQCGNPIFFGSHVRIVHPRHIELGSGCSLGDHVFIDGLSLEGVKLGNNVTLERYAGIRATGTLRNLGVGARIGDNCSLGAFSYVGAAGGVTIGDNVLIGPMVGIYAENHIFDNPDELIKAQGVRRVGISIGSDCWIGAGVSILDGVAIGNGCVIGAGSVVAKDVEPFSVVAGAPAVTIRKRKC